MPAIWLNCFSSGVATEDAIFSGLAPGSAAETRIESEWQTREERRQSCYHDGTKTQKRSFVDRLRGGEAASPFSLQREIDDHDAVFLDDTDQQNNADDGYDPEILPEEHECQQRADSGRRKC